MLTYLTINFAGKLKSAGRVKFVRRNNIGTKRCHAIPVFTLKPFASTSLPVAHRNIVKNGVPQQSSERIFFIYPAHLLPNNKAKFDLPIYFCASGFVCRRHLNFFVGADERIRIFREDGGIFWDFESHFFGMIAVVEPGTKDFSRAVQRSYER